MANRHRRAERARHRVDDLVDRDRRTGREVHRRRGSARLHERDEPVDRIVDVHEVDEIASVAAYDELALTAGQREQPARRDLPRRVVRAVRAEEADSDGAGDRAPLLAEETDVVLGRELRDRVRQQRRRQ